MTYNSQREPLSLREYGRTVQDMVDYCTQLPDRQLRQSCAETIVALMAKMNGGASQQADFQHKLWDQIAIMSDYKLDIDYPYDITQPEDADARPKTLKYPIHRIRYRHYGHLVEAMLRKAGQMPEGAERDELTELLGNAMKQDLFDFNRDAMDENKIRTDIKAYTDGEVVLPEDFAFRSITGTKITEKTSRKKRRK